MQRLLRYRCHLGLTVIALVLAACTVPAYPPPDPSLPDASCGSQAAPSAANPVTYAVVVDTPGPRAPEVATFVARSQTEKDQKVEELARRGSVVAVEPEQSVTASSVTPDDDTIYYLQWAPAQANFPAAWNANGYDGTGVRIAIVDTGVRATHQDLVANIVSGRDFLGTDANGVPGGNVDLNGHGTAVAGVAAGADNTVGMVGGAPRASIVPVRVLNEVGQGVTPDVANGILWAAKPQAEGGGGAQVINLSLGQEGCSSTVLEAALEYAHDAGVVIAAAALNANSATAWAPAAYDAQVIAVASVNNAGDKASYSNYGAFVDIAAGGGDWGGGCDTLALTSYSGGPGSSFDSNDAYICTAGTSLASPLVSAAAALLIQKCPGIAPDLVRSKLRDHAGPPVPGYGFRRLDAGAVTAPGVSCT